MDGHPPTRRHKMSDIHGAHDVTRALRCDVRDKFWLRLPPPRLHTPRILVADVQPGSATEHFLPARVSFPGPDHSSSGMGGWFLRGAAGELRSHPEMRHQLAIIVVFRNFTPPRNAAYFEMTLGDLVGDSDHGSALAGKGRDSQAVLHSTRLAELLRTP